MILPDINVLIDAHRPESAKHAVARKALMDLAEGPSPLVLTSFVIAGFIRIVTNHRIYKEPTPLVQAMAFIDNLITLPHCRLVEAGERYWPILQGLLSEAKATANLVSDAALAAIAIENGCTLLTSDSDFKKFTNLRVEWL